jgi:hypothetical protein
VKKIDCCTTDAVKNATLKGLTTLSGMKDNVDTSIMTYLLTSSDFNLTSN